MNVSTYANDDTSATFPRVADGGHSPDRGARAFARRWLAFWWSPVVGFIEPGIPELTKGTARERLVSRVLVVLASIWFAAVAGWGMGGPVLAGHDASMASMGIIAENMWRWEILSPVWEYTQEPPRPDQVYCHHPWGIFWTTAVLYKVVGRSDVVCRLAAVLLSALTPSLLYLIGGALWRPAAGAASALIFVALPISLSFAHFNALEVPVIAWTLLSTYYTLRYWRHGRRAYLAGACMALALAVAADWPALVFAFVIWSAALFETLRPSAARRGRWRWLWIGLWAAVVAVVLVGHLAAFAYYDQLSNLGGAYEMRSRAAGPWWEAVLRRRYWLELMFTPVGLGLAAAGAVYCVALWGRHRSLATSVGLALFAMATVQYLVFRQGADVHIFWPHYFAPALALAAGGLLCSGAARVGRSRSTVIALSAVFALLWLAILRDGLQVVSYARSTGGRFNEKGLRILSDGDKVTALRWASDQYRANGTDEVALHRSMVPTWAQVWSLGGAVVRTQGVGLGGHTVHWLDARFLTDAQQSMVLKARSVRAIGPFWEVAPNAQTSAGLRIESFAFVERERTGLQWWWLGGTEPDRTIQPASLAAWELAHHFDLPGGDELIELPSIEIGVDDRWASLRLAHNAAVAAGDKDVASAMHHELVAPLQRIDEVAGEAKLLGWRYDAGARPLVRVLVSASGPMPQGFYLRLTTQVVAAPSWSLTMADPTVREVGVPPVIKASRWRDGFLYAFEAPIRHRPGREELIIEALDRTKRPLLAPLRFALPED